MKHLGCIVSQFLLLCDPLTDRRCSSAAFFGGWNAWFTQVHSLQVELAQSKTSNTEKARRIQRMQNESYVKHQMRTRCASRAEARGCFGVENSCLEGARALVSSSLDQLLQAFLGRGHLSLVVSHVSLVLCVHLFKACAKSDQTQKARTTVTSNNS